MEKKKVKIKIGFIIGSVVSGILALLMFGCVFLFALALNLPEADTQTKSIMTVGIAAAIIYGVVLIAVAAGILVLGYLLEKKRLAREEQRLLEEARRLEEERRRSEEEKQKREIEEREAEEREKSKSDNLWREKVQAAVMGLGDKEAPDLYIKNGIARFTKREKDALSVLFRSEVLEQTPNCPFCKQKMQHSFVKLYSGSRVQNEVVGHWVYKDTGVVASDIRKDVVHAAGAATMIKCKCPSCGVVVQALGDIADNIEYIYSGYKDSKRSDTWVYVNGKRISIGGDLRMTCNLTKCNKRQLEALREVIPLEAWDPRLS